jgi:hypothetical protein
MFLNCESSNMLKSAYTYTHRVAHHRPTSTQQRPPIRPCQATECPGGLHSNK